MMAHTVKPPPHVLEIPFPPLVPAVFERRLDRFIAEMRLCTGPDGAGGASDEVERAHCVNPGRMEAFVRPGAKIWLSSAEEGSKRKLKYTWELLEYDGAEGGAVVCGTNTQRPNLIVGEMLRARLMKGMTDYVELRSEYTIPKDMLAAGDSEKRTRVDFLLRSLGGGGGDDELHFVEVKNCHMVVDGIGYFPDSVSERASHHMHTLAELCRSGHRATVIFVIQREDGGTAMRPSDFHDPLFAAACRAARQAGVQFRALQVACRPQASYVMGEVPVDLDPYDTEVLRLEWERNVPYTGWIRGKSGNLVANSVFPHHKKKRATAKCTSKHFKQEDAEEKGKRPKDEAP